jgi:paraquat-inducible protein B
VQINIENKYGRLIRTNTVFWRKVAVQAKLGLFNSELKINSLDSILHGGIDFSTPEPVGPIAKARTRFGLEQAPPKDSSNWNPILGWNQ